jgi:ribosomal protein L23
MILLKPIISEKTLRLAEAFNMYTFDVTPSANKPEATKELERMFDVTVESVKVHKRLGKKVRFGKKKSTGKKNDRKIMIFRLSKGKIDIFRS